MGDDAFRDPRLSESYLIGDEEAIDPVGVEIKAAKGVIDRRTLKITERPAHLRRIRLRLCGHRRNASRALQIGFHTESKFGGRSDAPSSVFRKSSTSDCTLSKSSG